MKKTSKKTEAAFCWANGRIDFGQVVPEGAIIIARSKSKRLRDAVCVCARWSYPTKRGGKDSVPLVPGIPEGVDEISKLQSLQRFIEQVSLRLAA